MLFLLVRYLLVLVEILKYNPCEQVVFHAKYHTFSSGPTKSYFYHKIQCKQLVSDNQGSEKNVTL